MPADSGSQAVRIRRFLCVSSGIFCKGRYASRALPGRCLPHKQSRISIRDREAAGWRLSSPPKARLSKAGTGLKNAWKKLITASGIRKRFRDLKIGAGTGFSQNVLNSGKGAKIGRAHV